MLRKIVWCYILVLSLVDISVKSKLSAHGKTHDVNVNGHGDLSEAYSFTEDWIDSHDALPSTEKVHKTFSTNKDASELLIKLDPPTLHLPQSHLGEAVRTTVTLTNVGQDTLHLTSLAGNTPDFHASFFEHKTVLPGSNTSFSIVHVARQCGHSAGIVFVHTSRGVLRYAVSSQTGPSRWGLWPVHLTVPDNAKVKADLVVTNPTDYNVQVTEIYSSGSWLGLELLDGATTASKEQWMIPAGTTRTIARLAPSPQGGGPLFSAWVRVRGQHMPHAALLSVTALQVTAGIYVQPEQIRIPAAGSHGPPAQTTLYVGNSSPAAVTLDQPTVSLRCLPQPHHPPKTATATSAPGVTVQLLKNVIDPHSMPQPAVNVTFNFSAMWASYAAEHKDSANNEWELGAYCAGWVALGRSALPYSARVLAKGLTVAPTTIHMVREAAEAVRRRSLRVRNETPYALRLVELQLGARVHQYWHIKDLTGSVVRAGGEVVFAELTGRQDGPDEPLDSWIALHTNVSRVVVPVLVYSGQLHTYWEWPTFGHGVSLPLGTLPVSSTTRVPGALRNLGPQALCVTHMGVTVPGASLTTGGTRHSGNKAQMCIEPYGEAPLVLTVVAPARGGPIAGTINVATDHARTELHLTAVASEGRISCRPLLFHNAAPYIYSEAPLIIESTLKTASTLHVVQISQPANHRDPALILKRAESSAAAGTVHGSVGYVMERGCHPHCYTGLLDGTHDQRLWAQRAQHAHTEPMGVISEDMLLMEQRYKLFNPQPQNISLLVHTTEVIAIPCVGTVFPRWPRLTDGAVPAARASIGSRASIVVTVTNPSMEHPLLLQPLVHRPHVTHSTLGVSSWCETKACMESPSAFTFSAWSGEGVRGADGGGEGAPLLVLPRGGRGQLTILFNPQKESAMTATLYLRNNLTVIEPVPLHGQGCVPKLQLTPPSGQVFEVLECLRSVSRHAVTVRNTGAVPLSLTEWSISGLPCRNRGFSVEPCGPVVLRPNDTQQLTISFAADYSLATTAANLTVRADQWTVLWFPLLARTPLSVLSACNAAPPRPPWEGPLRRAGTLVAAAAAVLVLAVGALDADRLLRAHASHRGNVRPPLDLRAVAAERPSPPRVVARVPPPPLPRRRRRKHDPQAEGRAFDVWRGHTADRCTSLPSPPAYEPDPRDSPDEDSTTSSELSSPAADPCDGMDRENTSDEGPNAQSEPPPTPDTATPPIYPAVSSSPPRRRPRRGTDDRAPRPARRTRPSQPKRRAPAAVSQAPPATPVVTEASSTTSTARYPSWSSVVVGHSPPTPTPAPTPAPPVPPLPPTLEIPPLPPLPQEQENSLFYFNGSHQYSWPITYDNHALTYDNKPLTYDNKPLTYDNKPLTYDNKPLKFDVNQMPYESVTGQSLTYEATKSYDAKMPFENVAGQSLPYETTGPLQYESVPGQSLTYESHGKNSPYESLTGQSMAYESQGKSSPFESVSPTYESVPRHSPYDSVHTTPTSTPDGRPFDARPGHTEDIKMPTPINPMGPVGSTVGSVGQPPNTTLGSNLGTMNLPSSGTSLYSSWGNLEARAPGAGWNWMRPPPGFAPSSTSSSFTSQPPPRPFDPFQSLAAIWTRTALDWRAEDVDDKEQ